MMLLDDGRIADARIAGWFAEGKTVETTPGALSTTFESSSSSSSSSSRSFIFKTYFGRAFKTGALSGSWSLSNLCSIS
jgi:hypothetical protein